jgi:LysR family transcriptional activator of nhaA
MVITDCPIPPGIAIKGYSHLLGESGVTFMSSSKISDKFKGEFPYNLQDAPFLLPTYASAIRSQIDQFFASKDINIDIICEFDDSALIKLFGAQGIGVFCIPSAIEKEVKKTYDVQVVGRTNAITEKFYLISSQKKIKNPGGLALIEAAKNFLL